MAGEEFAKQASLTGPATDGFAVTKSDVTVFPATRGLYVGTAGDLVVTMLSGAVLTFANAAAGYHPLRVTQVRDATAATGIVGVY